jgi:hypothetical protein
VASNRSVPGLKHLVEHDRYLPQYVGPDFAPRRSSS